MVNRECRVITDMSEGKNHKIREKAMRKYQLPIWTTVEKVSKISRRNDDA